MYLRSEMSDNKSKWKGKTFGKYSDSEPKKVKPKEEVEPKETSNEIEESQVEETHVLEAPEAKEIKPEIAETTEEDIVVKEDEEIKVEVVESETPVAAEHEENVVEISESPTENAETIVEETESNTEEGPIKKRAPRPRVQKVVEEPKADEEPKEEDEPEPIRLNKYIAKAGVCSRRDADKLIAKGDVEVDGKVITELGTKILPTATVKLRGEILSIESLKYVLLNKPKDSVTTMDDTHDRRTVMDLVSDACKERIYPVGRLDRMTTGLLLLTNDGELAKRLTHPSHKVVKNYVATLNKPIEPQDLRSLLVGVQLEDGECKFDTAEFDDKTDDGTVVLVSLHSGKNRIVRRMFSHLGYRVEKLDRIEFAGLKKGSLTRGRWRFLTEKEVGFLKMIN